MTNSEDAPRRTVNLQCLTTEELRDRVDRYAEDHRWSRSTALEQLIQRGLLVEFRDERGGAACRTG